MKKYRIISFTLFSITIINACTKDEPTQKPHLVVYPANDTIYLPANQHISFYIMNAGGGIMDYSVVNSGDFHYPLGDTGESSGTCYGQVAAGKKVKISVTVALADKYYLLDLPTEYGNFLEQSYLTILTPNASNIQKSGVEITIMRNNCIPSPTMSLGQANNPGYDVCGIENAFTPNGDGVNDFLLVAGGTMGQLTITDNCSNKIFQTNSPASQFWDGKYMGNDAPAGIYNYTLAGCGSGLIQLVR